MIYITNSYSDNMIDWSTYPYVETKTKVIDLDWLVSWLFITTKNEYKSIVGHADTAALYERLLGKPIPANRESITIDPLKDSLLIGQYKGPRLKEGECTLPKGATIVWLHKVFRVEIGQ